MPFRPAVFRAASFRMRHIFNAWPSGFKQTDCITPSWLDRLPEDSTSWSQGDAGGRPKRLKRDVIPAIVHRLNEGQAAHAILYDHLFNKTLSDFELFKGFQQLLELDPTLSLRTLSQEIGWPLWRIKRVMAFGRLPDAAQAVLSTNPDIISAGLAYRLAGQAARGRQGHVVEAIRR